jgi:glycine/D-amino acid oxidase-like deaminating enzyme
MRKAITSPHASCQLFTFAPVTSYNKAEDGRWDVHVEHGGAGKAIKAGKVVLCTNAYTKNFFKEDDEEEELLHSQ